MKMANHYQNDYRKQLLNSIESRSSEVFSRGDLTADLSNKEQLRLNRALNAFIDEGVITKISHNLYAKSQKVIVKENDVRVMLRKNFEAVAIEALNKLKLKWELGSAIQAYNRGETTQIPIRFSVKLHSRFRGKIHAEGREVIFENGTNAR